MSNTTAKPVRACDESKGGCGRESEVLGLMRGGSVRIVPIKLGRDGLCDVCRAVLSGKLQ